LKFKIAVTGYNCEKWIGKCLKSIKEQTYKDFDCVFIDDASTDNTFEVACNTIGEDRRFKLLKHKQRRWSLATTVHCIKELNPEDDDVIILVDGDDWLAHEKVLERVKEEYDKGAWATYGQYIRDNRVGGCTKAYPEETVKKGNYREVQWAASHLKTFKYFLFKRIKDEDFRDDKGEYLKAAQDQAIMLPILEMAREKAHFIPDILYVYNTENPLQIYKQDIKLSLECAKIVRSKAKYSPIR